MAYHKRITQSLVKNHFNIPLVEEQYEQHVQQEPKIDDYQFLDKGFTNAEIISVFGLVSLCNPPYLAATSMKHNKTPVQSSFLEEIFKITPFPSTETRNNIGHLIAIPPRSVQVWFQNKRQRSRTTNKKRGQEMSQASDISEIELVQILLEIDRKYRQK